MKKFISIIIASLLIVGLSALSVSARAEALRLADDANLLEPNEENAIIPRLDRISKEFDYDICIITVDNVNYYSAEKIADDFVNVNYGNESNVVMLMVTFFRGEREWHIFRYNDAENAISEGKTEAIFDEMQSVVNGNDYRAAFNAFINECEYYIDGHINGFPFEMGKNIVISVVVGFVIAFIVVSVMKGKLKSVALQRDATTYVKQGSMKVTVFRDFFLYRTITRTAKPKNNGSGGRTSSGGSHSSRRF